MVSKERVKILSFVALLVFVFGGNSAHGQTVSSTSFTIQGSNVKQGSVFSTSSNFQLWSSVGEISIGSATTSNFVINAGFLYVPSVLLNQSDEDSEDQDGSSEDSTVTIIVAGGGGITIPLPRAKSSDGFIASDFNSDGKVDISDLSILLYYFGRPYSGAMERFDLSRDRKIDIFDISILLYYW